MRNNYWKKSDEPCWFPLAIWEYQKIHQVAEELEYKIEVTGVHDFPYRIYCSKLDLDELRKLEKK